MKTTGVFEQIANAWLEGKRNIWLEGGTSAGKTYSTIQFLHFLAMGTKSPLLISVVSETVPHLKRGCLRDFVNILGDRFEESRFNRTDLIYSYDNAQIEFFSADNPSKLRGARRKVLFINEANNVPYDAYMQLDTRTELLTICDWNPVSEFWYHENNLLNENGVYIHSTYKDALSVIPQAVVDNIEQTGKRDKNWWNVYGLGKIGKVEGLVYQSFETIKELPKGEYFYGLDFGYMADPTALVKNVIHDDKLYSQELIYLAGLSNAEIAYKMKELEVDGTIWADSAEPKSIDEIYKYGFDIRPCVKGQGSVEYGHQKVRQYEQFVTEDSLNLIKELRNCRYIEDKNKKITDKITHMWTHGLDARRYAVDGYTGSVSYFAVY